MSSTWRARIASLMAVGMLLSGCRAESAITDTTELEETMETEESITTVTTTADTTAKPADPLKKPDRYLTSAQYSPPYQYPTDDRLAEAMPTPFDANILPRQDILYEDFEDDVFDKLEFNYGPRSAIGNGMITLKDGDKSVCLKWRAQAGVDASPGDYFMLSCRIKGENISGTGNYRSILQVYNDKGKWMAETHQFKQKTDTDWTEYQQILQVPETANDLEPPKYYDIQMMAYRNEINGTIYFDDFKLSKVIFDPMDTVLMAPAYKGIIKGEDGVGDIALRVYVSDENGLHDLSQFSLINRITDEDCKVYLESSTDTVMPVMDVGFSSAALPMNGDYYLESILVDKESGKEIQRQEWMLHKRPADFTTVVSYDEYNRVLYNGEPMLPVRVYNSTSYDDCVADILAAGSIDTLMHVGYGWYLNYGTNAEYRNMVQKLQDNGKTITLSTGPMCFSNLYNGHAQATVKTQADIRGLLSKFVNNFKDLPNLFDYYLYDEQNGMRYGNELAWARQIIESLDLDHPTTCAIDVPIPTRPGVYAKTSDFLGTDPYPVTGKENQDISLVYDRIVQMRQLNPGRPVYLIAQQFWYDARGDLRGPTLEEFRNMYFQAICAGSCMFDNYSYRSAKEGPSPNRTFEEEWKDYTTVYAELQQYEDVILSIEPAPYYTVEDGGDWFNHTARRHDGTSYLFAVNNDTDAHTVRVFFDGVKTITGQYSGVAYTADESGWFTIPMDKYAVDVFAFEQAEYASSHAELLRLVLHGMMITDPIGESVIMTNGAASVEYSARISDFAQLYINGKAVETSGTLSLQGLDRITITVVSEDGRFQTEKIYAVK